MHQRACVFILAALLTGCAASPRVLAPSERPKAEREAPQKENAPAPQDSRIASATPSVPDSWAARLEEALRPELERFTGELSLYVADGASGEEVAFDADRPTYLSSAIKLAVALEVLAQVDSGLLSLDETVLFTEDDVRDGVGPIQQPPEGKRFRIDQLLELMLVYSDNAAADLLMGVVTLPRIEAQLARRAVRFGPIETLLGERQRIYGRLAPHAPVLRAAQVRALGRFDRLDARAEALSRMLAVHPPQSGAALAESFEAYYAEGINSASMRALGALLGQVARCEGLSPQSCARLHSLMRDCRTGRNRIRAGLPASIPWAHKTGTQYRRACDVGIAEVSPGRPIVIAACTRNFRHLDDAERLFAAIGRAVADVSAAPDEKGPPPEGSGPADGHPSE